MGAREGWLAAKQAYEAVEATRLAKLEAIDERALYKAKRDTKAALDAALASGDGSTQAEQGWRDATAAFEAYEALNKTSNAARNAFDAATAQLEALLAIEAQGRTPLEALQAATAAEASAAAQVTAFQLTVATAAATLEDAEAELIAGTGTLAAWKAAKSTHDGLVAQLTTASESRSDASRAVSQARHALANE